MDPSLAALAEMLKRTQHQRVMENPTPASSSVTIPATPPALPQFQSPTAGSMLPSMAQYMKATPPINPDAPPISTAGAVPINAPPSVQPGDQTLPSTMTQSATAADAMNPIAQAPSVWETMKKLLAQGQIPEGYRGAMGEMIKNG